MCERTTLLLLPGHSYWIESIRRSVRVAIGLMCNITFPLLNKLQFIDTCTDLGDRLDCRLDLS